MNEIVCYNHCTKNEASTICFFKLFFKRVSKHDQAYNFAFRQKLELLQHNASLAITDAIRITSKGNFTRTWVLNQFNQGVGIEN